MENIKDNKSFLFSQNSLSTFLLCPYKFKYKYIDGIIWSDDDESDDPYKIGNEFHIMAERYFLNIPTGEEYLEDETVKNYLKLLKEKFPYKQKFQHNVEYEIRYKKDEIRLLARYDLIRKKGDNYEIWDWKTGEKKLTYEKQKNKLQSKIYMFLLKEKEDIEASKITMNYWQPSFPNDKIQIAYNESDHKKNKSEIEDIIHEIYNTKTFKKTEYVKMCTYCEFEKICKNN
ncbi:MAG: PD-(D/E)XK nuclease family protein [Fusobacteriota bacterium]